VREVHNQHSHILGITANPDADSAWATQEGRHLLADLGERVSGFIHLIRGRVGQFTESFDVFFDSEDVQVTRSPQRLSSANGRAERFVLSVRAERTDRMLIYNVRHVATATGYQATTRSTWWSGLSPGEWTPLNVDLARFTGRGS
jgi:hypothetical protein